MNGFSMTRVLAVMIKEFKQLTRDRLTYAMMLAIPVVQLLLFGYAINSEPRHLPTALLVQEDNVFARSITGYKAQVADASAQVLLLVSRDLDLPGSERVATAKTPPHMVKVG